MTINDKIKTIQISFPYSDEKVTTLIENGKCE